MRRLCAAGVMVTVFILLIGCGGPAVMRAPVNTIPDSLDVDAKIQMLQDMSVNYPDDADLYFELGNLYYDNVQPTESRINYEKALQLDPSMNKARVNLAMLLVETDEADSAEALLEEAIRLDPNDAKAYNNLGMVYYSQLDVNNAVKYFEKALKIDPANLEALYNLGLAFAETGLLLEAIREWRSILDITEEGETAERAKLSLDRVERELKQ
jgi:tetratricopeptide (TPR) repeat protein